MNNLEIKVQVGNVEDIKSRLGFAEYKGTLEQKDSYFLLGKTRLKIREEKKINEIILYTRELKGGTRKSTYHRVVLSPLSTRFFKAIIHLVFGIKVIVEKQRDLYIYKNTRIHLDVVTNLSEFVELETVIKEINKEEEYLAEHEEIKRRLMLSMYPTIPGSYSDLLNNR